MYIISRQKSKNLRKYVCVVCFLFFLAITITTSNNIMAYSIDHILPHEIYRKLLLAFYRYIILYLFITMSHFKFNGQNVTI